MNLHLQNVTLLGIDCVNVERLQVAMDICQEHITFGAVKLLTSLPTNDSRLVTIPNISSIEVYSKFCIEKLTDYVDTEFVLLVQYDGFILNPTSWTDQFLNYDYIGAPLSWGVPPQADGTQTYTVGNGGFCIRSKKFLDTAARLVRDGQISKFDPEDAALCIWYKDLFLKEGLTYAPVDLAMKFSVVEDYGVYDAPFGFHGLFNKNMDSLLASHPNFPTHVFMPRIVEKRLEKVKTVFEKVALAAYVPKKSVENTEIILVIADEHFAELVNKRQECFEQIKTFVSITDLTSQDALNTDLIRSKVQYTTKLGDFTFTYSLYKKSTLSEIPDGKQLF